MDFTLRNRTHPPVPSYDALVQLLPEAFRGIGLPPDFGWRIAPTFVGAGLPYPTTVAEMLTGGGPGTKIFAYTAATIVSVASQFDRLGIKMPAGFAADETLAERMQALLRQHCTQANGSIQYGDRTRK